MSDRSDDDELDDASLKSMRAVWLSMRDEDPPAAGMSALMAAAAQKADQMREQPSWWQRLFTQLRRPPALAFATVMLLIGGAVLVTRNPQDKVDALTADTPAAEHVELRQQSATQPQEAPTAATVAPTDPAEPVPQEEEAKQNTAAPQLERGKTESKTEKQPPKPKRPVTAKETDVGENEPDRHNRFDSDVKPGFSGTKSGEDKTVLESPAGKGPAPATVPPPEPPRPALTESADEGDAITRDEKVSSPKKPEAVKDSAAPKTSVKPRANEMTNEQLAKQAEERAARGDCAAVREIVAQLRRNDEAFYKQRLGKNAAVAKCF